jgi:hypothetical protein
MNKVAQARTTGSRRLPNCLGVLLSPKAEIALIVQKSERNRPQGELAFW